MHRGVLDAAGVLGDGQPLADALVGVVEGAVGVVGAEVAVLVPGRVDEGVHGVGLALGVLAADGALRLPEALAALERRFAGGDEVGVLRQDNGQVFLGDRDGAVVGAVDDRDRRAPVALAADQPVAQAVGDRLLGEAVLSAVINDLRLAVDVGRAVEGAGVDHAAFVDVRLGQRCAGVVWGRDHDLDVEAVLWWRTRSRARRGPGRP